MKTLWTALCILAVAHVLALAGFTGFLFGTDRISRDRIDRVREIFVLPLAQESAANAKAATEVQQAADQAAELAQIDAPSDGADARNTRLRTTEDLLREQLDRAKRDMKNLQIYLDSEMAKLEAARTVLEKEKAQFQADRERITRLERDEQFAQTVDMFAGLSAQNQKGLVQEYLGQGRVELVIDILDAMDERKAQKLLKEFKSPEETKVAADLLLRLKERGFGTGAP